MMWLSIKWMGGGETWGRKGLQHINILFLRVYFRVGFNKCNCCGQILFRDKFIKAYLHLRKADNDCSNWQAKPFLYEK